MSLVVFGLQMGENTLCAGILAKAMPVCCQCENVSFSRLGGEGLVFFVQGFDRAPFPLFLDPYLQVIHE